MEPDSWLDGVDDGTWADEGDEIEGIGPSPWRRRVIAIVAVVAALGLAAGPLYNLVGGGQPQVAENGLEVCGFDYCIVQDALRTADLDVEAGRLSNLILSEAEAVELAAVLVSYLDIEPVELTVVDRLGGRLGGIYDPRFRTILIERPATAWVVTHEVAHAAASGHGTPFQDVLIDLIQSQSQ